RGLCELADSLNKSSRFEESLEASRVAGDVAESIGSDVLQSTAFELNAWAWSALSRFQQAFVSAGRALDCAARTNDRRCQAKANNTAGTIHARTADYAT